MIQSVEAAARGDAASALRHELAVSVLPEAPYTQVLREIVSLGDAAPTWVYSRWMTLQAYRWLMTSRSQTVDIAVVDVLAQLHRDIPLGTAEQLFEAGTRIAAGDWVAQQLAVFEYGGLRRFLDTVARPTLTRRADRIQEWALARMAGYRLEGASPDGLVVSDFVDGSTCTVLDLGALTKRDRGTTVIGRLVPIDVEPHLMFESRPLSVDEGTAAAVTSSHLDHPGDPRCWLYVLGEACEDGRLAPGFSTGQATPLTSDRLLHWRASLDHGHANRRA